MSTLHAHASLGSFALTKDGRQKRDKGTGVLKKMEGTNAP